MITFQEFMQESSLSRIKSKSDKGGVGILSGSRGDKSAKENRARAKQLDKDIRGKFGRTEPDDGGSYDGATCFCVNIFYVNVKLIDIFHAVY